MNDNFKEQKDVLESLIHEIKLLHQQVSFLIRNEREVGLLDLDVMMNRTHTIYDKLCGINIGKDEDLELNEELMKGLLGWDNDKDEQEKFEEEVNEEIYHGENYQEEIAENHQEEVNEEIPQDEVNQDIYQKCVNQEVIQDDLNERINKEEKDQEIVENKSFDEIQKTESDEDRAIDFGFIFKEEETEALTREQEEPEKEVYTTGDQIEMKIPPYETEFPEEETELLEEETEILEPEEEIGFQGEETEFQEEKTEFPKEESGFQEEEEEFQQEEETEFQEEVFREEEIEAVAPREETELFEKEMETPREEYRIPYEEEREATPYEPVLFGNMEEKEELGFELDTPETIGERLRQEEDHSLAAKLQHKPVADLRTAIGINDKFLLVNELFSGNMEKYNKSIENLNDLPTLDGAMGYLDELYVVYQWNRNNEAYKKLVDLVHRKFES